MLLVKGDHYDEQQQEEKDSHGDEIEDAHRLIALHSPAGALFFLFPLPAFIMNAFEIGIVNVILRALLYVLFRLLIGVRIALCHDGGMLLQDFHRRTAADFTAAFTLYPAAERTGAILHNIPSFVYLFYHKRRVLHTHFHRFLTV